MNDDLPISRNDLLSFSISQRPGCVVVSVTGEIDLDTEQAFHGALTAAMAGGALHLVVDLAAVTYMGSTGIGVLMGVRRVLVAHGGSLVLACPPGKVAQVLALTGVGDVIPVDASVAEAVARWAA
jgi:anti-sigma B factor antagonist